MRRTPCTLMTSVPAPRTSAPMVFRKSATSTICGSLATFSRTVEPVRHNGGQHGVDGGAHRNRVEENFFPAQHRGGHFNHAVVHHVLGAKGREGLQMLVDGARAR